MKEITIAADFLDMLIEGAQRQNLDYDKILLAHGLAKPYARNSHQKLKLDQPKRVPLESFAAVAIQIMRELNDEALGLATRKQRLGSFNMMCRSCISAKTIKRSMKRAANFWNLFENTWQHQVLIGSESSCYRLTPLPDQAPLNQYLVDANLSAIHRFHCWLAGQFIPIKKVSKTEGKPPYHKEFAALYYGAEIEFGTQYNQIELDSRHLNTDIIQTTDTLDQYLLGTNLSLLYQPKNYRVLSDQVRHWLEKNIRQGNNKATLDRAAKHFQMSHQVLHRRLLEEGVSFKEIKQQTRRDIAINHLFEEKYKIEEISSLVGFSEPSAFIRAFKQWTGLTPLNYRQRELKQ